MDHLAFLFMSSRLLPLEHRSGAGELLMDGVSLLCRLTPSADAKRRLLPLLFRREAAGLLPGGGAAPSGSPEACPYTGAKPIPPAKPWTGHQDTRTPAQPFRTAQPFTRYPLILLGGYHDTVQPDAQQAPRFPALAGMPGWTAIAERPEKPFSSACPLHRRSHRRSPYLCSPCRP